VGQRLNQTPEGFFVPYDWAGRGLSRRNGERRDLVVATPSAGGYFVAEDILMQSFIELLRNRMVVRQAGATVLTGLVGDLSLPKQTSGATAYWLGESGAPNESQQVIGQVALTPRTVGAFTDYSRRLMLQTALDVEAFVRNDLAAVLQLAIDLASLHGAGAGNEPLGVANTTGIGAPGVGAATLAMIVGLETAVAVDNADVGRLSYITNATVRGTLKQTDIGTDTGIMLWNTMAGNTPINGYPAAVTNQVALTNIFFGNWGDLIIAFWSGLDIMVDPYTHSTSGTMRVVALQDCDVAVRHPESFAIDATS
jgi:HK97 family phage major capsid protein